jgi:hypothetical protein
MQVLRDLRLALHSRWDEGRIRYFRFGPRVVDLPAGFDFEPALHPGFYDQFSTAIQGPLGSIAGDTLTLLVTDLCQDDGNVAAMIQALRSRVLSTGLSVAVWGVKSEFNGRASCLWPPVPGFYYRSTNDPKTHRPFYIVAIGNVEQILSFSDEMARISRVASRDHLLVLTPQVLRANMAWTPAKMHPEGVVARADIAQESSRGVPFGRFELRQTSGSATLTAEFEIQPTPNSPRLEFSKVNPIAVRSVVWQGGKSRPWADAASAVSAHFKHIGDNREAMTVTLDPTRMGGRGVYAIELRPPAGRHAFELPKWSSEWSINSRQAAECLTQPGSIECNKTLNLWEFISSLWAVMVDHHKPQLGCLYLYVKR